MGIDWTEEKVSSWSDGIRSQRLVRIAKGWRFRVASDRLDGKLDGKDAPASSSRSEDFSIVLDRDFQIWTRRFLSVDDFGKAAEGNGVSVQLAGDITRGIHHEVRVRVKPGEETVARWSCTCGLSSRGDLSPDSAREEADAHVADTSVKPAPGPVSDFAIVSALDGSWQRGSIFVLHKERVCIRSDLSIVRSHQAGYGEEFEFVVDTTLRLWFRQFGVGSALRRDEDGRGVSVFLLGD